MNSGKGAGARAIYDETNAALSSVVNLIRSDLVRSDVSSIGGYSTSLEVLIDQRSTKLLPIDFRDSRIESAKKMRALSGAKSWPGFWYYYLSAARNPVL
jgi:hypothetical protein